MEAQEEQTSFLLLVQIIFSICSLEITSSLVNWRARLSAVSLSQKKVFGSLLGVINKRFDLVVNQNGSFFRIMLSNFVEAPKTRKIDGSNLVIHSMGQDLTMGHLCYSSFGLYCANPSVDSPLGMIETFKRGPTSFKNHPEIASPFQRS